MTTTITNGSTQGRIVDHVEGTVVSVNPRGVKLAGTDDYLNFSKYADPPIAAPNRGAHVRLALDGSGFVRQLQVLDDDGASAPAAPRDRTITRLSVLKSAAMFLGQMSQCREDVRSEHVLVLADKWLRWVEKGNDREEDEDAF